jgi:hypothetical protein
MNLVFVKTSRGTLKGLFVIFPKCKEGRLEFGLLGHLLPTTTSFNVQVHSTRLETESALKNTITCECDIFT